MKIILIALVCLLASLTPSYGQRPCDRGTPFQHTTATGPVEIVPGIANQRIYLCGYMIAQKAQSLDMQILAGSDSTCLLNQIAVTPVFSLPNDFAIVNRLENTGPALPVGYSLCLQTSGTGALTGIIYWAQF